VRFPARKEPSICADGSGGGGDAEERRHSAGDTEWRGSATHANRTPREFVPAPHCIDWRSAIVQLFGGGGCASASAADSSSKAAARIGHVIQIPPTVEYNKFNFRF
jgi:hypothetical protein